MDRIIIDELKKEFIAAANRAYNSKIQTGTGGNISIRVPGEDIMLIKPSGISFTDCTMDNIILTTLDGQVIEGDGKPSREAYLHREIYKLNDEINSIVHCHAPWSIAWSLREKVLDTITQHAKLKLVNQIPVIDIIKPVITEEEIDKILCHYTDNTILKAFLLKGHGIVAVGSKVRDTEYLAELIEETAQISCIDRSM
jgi:L-ribulose-5-phosphate 4-epimerase